MKLKVDFGKILAAFEASQDTLHFFIDAKENEIVVLTEMDATQEDFERMEDGRYTEIPVRTSHKNFQVMKSFVYEIAEEDFKLAEKFHAALKERKPFRGFKDLLCQHPELRQKWFEFEREEMRNAAITGFARTT